MPDLGAAYDPEADALYVTVQAGRVITTMAVTDTVNVDLDEDHQIIGVEVLGVTGRARKAECGCDVEWIRKVSHLMSQCKAPPKLNPRYGAQGHPDIDEESW